MMFAGAALMGVGAIVYVLSKTSMGHLPGDVVIHRKNFTFAFPIVTCIVISILATLVMWILSRLRH